ncbi:MAG TPA: hypothetical protein VFT47_21555 [Vicinamibacterales bacterium]|nr:hypothetical protein [Vicinamibacterales bacterium]
MRSKAIALALFASLGLLGDIRAAGPRFYPDDPLAVDDDRLIDVTTAHKIDLDDYYDFLQNSFGAPGDRRNVRAVNVNTLDEVPDSSWFTNRIGAREMSIDELTRGSDRDVRFGTAWTILRGKNHGFHPGFRAIDRSDPSETLYQLEVDPPDHPEMATGAEIVGTAFYHAFGYHTIDVYLAEIDPATLEISPEATIKDTNGRRPFVRKDLDEVLKNAARLPNGRIRVSVERLTRGADMGRFEYHGTRNDDPNDIYPHEHRRELRGSRVFAAWLNHDDSRAVNTMVVRHIENRRASLRYYMVDFGSLLGSGTRFPNRMQSGHEYTLAKGPSLLTLLSFGFYVRPWLRLPDPPTPPSVGRFTAEGFDPRTWVAEYPKAAFDNMRPDDAFWAARIVSRFSDDAIRAIVRKGKYSDPAATEALAVALIRRRDRIAETWLTDINPIVNATLSAEGELRFENAAVLAGVGGRPERYTLRWSRFDNATDSHTSVGDAVTVTEPRSSAPAGVLRGSDYVSVSIATDHSRYPKWRPVQVYFRRTAAGWQTVGLDRGLDAK